MTKKEAFQLMNLIAEYYDHFSIDQNKLNAWFEGLKTVDYEVIKQNLVDFAMESAVPPRLSDLLKKKSASSRDIPDVLETFSILNTNTVPANDEVVVQELAKMREILGIKRS